MFGDLNLDVLSSEPVCSYIWTKIVHRSKPRLFRDLNLDVQRSEPDLDVQRSKPRCSEI